MSAPSSLCVCVKRSKVNIWEKQLTEFRKNNQVGKIKTDADNSKLALSAELMDLTSIESLKA